MKTVKAKGHIARLTATCMIITALFGGAASADSVTVTAERLNMRKEADASSKAMSVVEENDTLSFVSESGDWYQVKSGSKTGYVMKDYVNLDEQRLAADVEANTEAYAASAVTTDRVNMRKLPMTDADIAKVVPKKGKVQITGVCGDWYKVSYDGKTGYIMAKYLTVESSAGSTESAPAETPDEELYAAAKAGTTTARVNMRKSASTGASVVKVIGNGDSVSVLGENGSWYKVSVGGKEGYIVKNYIRVNGGTDSEDEKETVDAVVPDGFVSYPAARTGATTERVNMRDAASTGADVAKVLNKNTSVTVLGEQGGFYQVKYGSVIGYISKAYVSLGTAGSADTDADTSEKAEGGMDETLYSSTRTAMATVRVNMRREPEGDVLHTLAADTYVTLIGESGSWYKVIYSNSTGYISKAYLTEEIAVVPEQPEKDDAETEITGKGTTAYVTGSSVNMRKGAGTGYGVVKVLKKGDEITYYSLNDGWYLIKAGDDAGYISSKYVSTTKPETAPANPSESEEEADVGKVQMADWWTSDIQKVFARGDIATVTDVDTGISWKVLRSGGTNHADVQPLTAADTAKMKQAYGGSWSWNRRAIWVTIDGGTYAASMNGMPHGTGSITNNNFDGHHCIHFLNSRTHTGNRWDTAHQAAVQKAYKAGQ